MDAYRYLYDSTDENAIYASDGIKKLIDEVEK